MIEKAGQQTVVAASSVVAGVVGDGVFVAIAGAADVARPVTDGAFVVSAGVVGGTSGEKADARGVTRL